MRFVAKVNLVERRGKLRVPAVKDRMVDCSSFAGFVRIVQIL